MSNESFKISKKGQASRAAVLIIAVALALVVYIVTIPPADRAALFAGNPDAVGSYSSSSGASGNVVADNDFRFTGPGFVDDSDEGQILHRLPAVNLRTRVNSEILIEDPAFYVTQSMRTDRNKVMVFSIDDLDSVDNVYMAFVASKRVGVLTVDLNGNTIYEGALEKAGFAPLKISKSMLKKSNIIEFNVNEVGLLFWKKNEYIIEDFKVFGDVVSRSEQSSYITFDVSANEEKFLEKMSLEFYPDCEQKSVSRLQIRINEELVYNQVPDCNVLNKFDLPTRVIESGSNSLEFETEADTYLIDRIELESELSENDDFIYYFEMDERMFNSYDEAKAVCGEFDGSCPDGCSEDLDKDCCFVEYFGNGYWCDIPTQFVNERCIAKVTADNVGDCSSGYEDKSGDPADLFEDMCGDDTDGECPVGCSADLDKDCCLVEDSGNFWCDDLPLNGVSGICMDTVNSDQCGFCPSGYEGEEFDPDCSYDSSNPLDYVSNLKGDYNVKLSMKFVESSERKRGLLRINGYETSFSTYDDEVEKKIDKFVEEGTNYVQVIPQNSFNLVSLRVRVLED